MPAVKVATYMLKNYFACLLRYNTRRRKVLCINVYTRLYNNFKSSCKSWNTNKYTHFLQRHMANQTFMDKSEPSAKTEMQNEYFSSQHAILTAQHPLRIQKIPVVRYLVGALWAMYTKVNVPIPVDRQWNLSRPSNRPATDCTVKFILTWTAAALRSFRTERVFPFQHEDLPTIKV